MGQFPPVLWILELMTGPYLLPYPVPLTCRESIRKRQDSACCHKGQKLGVAVIIAIPTWLKREVVHVS